MVALMHRTVEFERATRIGASYPQCFNRKNGSLRRLEICALGYSSHTWGGFILQNYVTYFCELAPNLLFRSIMSSLYFLSYFCWIGYHFVIQTLARVLRHRLRRDGPLFLHAGYLWSTSSLPLGLHVHDGLHVDDWRNGFRKRLRY